MLCQNCQINLKHLLRIVEIKGPESWWIAKSITISRVVNQSKVNPQRPEPCHLLNIIWNVLAVLHFVLKGFVKIFLLIFEKSWVNFICNVNNYHQITVMERFDQSKMSFNCYPHCCSNISYSMVWQAIFNLNIPYNLTLHALAHSWTSFEKSDSFWINSDKFHGNRGTFKKNHNSKYLWMQKLKKYLLG